MWIVEFELDCGGMVVTEGREFSYCEYSLRGFVWFDVSGEKEVLKNVDEL